MTETEQGGIFSLLNDLILNYNDIILVYIKMLEYCGKNADSFSIITSITKPYSKIPPNCKHDNVLQFFQPYIIKQIIGVKEWPGTTSRFDSHKMLNKYKCCKETRRLLTGLPNIFLAIENNLPEDICFYRNGNAWFYTVSHEKMAFIANATKEDFQFLNRYSISYKYNVFKQN